MKKHQKYPTKAQLKYLMKIRGEETHGENPSKIST
jgi:hypothetical protein